MKRAFAYFTTFEKLLWCASVAAIVAAFLLFDGTDVFTLAASIIGVTFILFNAKGNPIGQVLTIIFSVMYGFISYSYAYYGEMISFLGMTTPMAVIALVAWLRHPFQGNQSQVEVNTIAGREIAFMFFLTAVVTTVFYFILWELGTSNLIPSTLSITTSFLGMYLTFRRSRYFNLAYACNDLILIVLWLLASLQDSRYISVLVCFVVFCANDLYGFVNWTRMKKQQG